MTSTNRGRMLLTGASGLVGRAVASRWRELGGEVVELAHKPRPGALVWNPEKGEMPAQALDGVDVVVHLAGENIGQRWSATVKKKIHDSRTFSTRLLAEKMAALAPEMRPRIFVCASAIGFYGYSRKEVVDESSAPGTGFLMDVTCAWEASTRPAIAAGIRTAFVRLGVVLAGKGGAVEQLLKVFHAGMAGPVGAGTQRMSWIGLSDVVEAIQFIADHEALHGPINLVAPQPCTNREITEMIGKIINKSVKPAIPAFALKLMFGEMATETMLSDLAVNPRKLREAGFAWRHPDLESALRFELEAEVAKRS